MHRLLYDFSGYRTQALQEMSAIIIQKAYRAYRKYGRQKVHIAMRFPKSQSKEDAISGIHIAQDLEFWERQRALIRCPASDGFELV